MPASRAVSLALLLLAPAGGLAQPKLVQHETEHYVLLTDLDPGEVPQVTAWLEAMHSTYRRVFRGDPVHRLPKAKVRVFKREADFQAHDPEMSDARGYYDREAHELVSYRGESVLDLCSLLSHEGVHQFLNEFANKDGEGFPGWFEEGLAEYFSTTTRTRDGKRLARQRSPAYVRVIREALPAGKLWSLAKLWGYDVDALPAEEAETFYAHASLLVEFLVREQPKTVQALYRHKREGAANGALMEKVFGKDPGKHAQLEARWREWLARLPEPAEESEGE